MDGSWTRARGATAEAQGHKMFFESLDEANELIIDMDHAVERPVLIGEYPIEIGDPARAEGVYTDKYKGVWNETTNKLANIVSPSYAILQHSNFFEQVINGLDNAGVGGISGEFTRLQGGNQFRMQVTFQDIEIAEPTKYRGTINPGALFTNSYDKSSSARGYGYFYRKVCGNGMILQHLIKGADFSRNHVAKDEATLLQDMDHRVWEFAYVIAKSDEMVSNAISVSAERQLDFEARANIIPTLQSIVGAKKHADGIFEILDIKDTETTYWDVYNAFTDYATHNDLSVTVQDRIQSVAEMVLLTPGTPNIKIVPPELIEVSAV